MGIFSNAFTWWNGASWGTSIVSHFRGEEVGRDAAGNVYYRHRKNPARRWVIYSASNDASITPPGWNAWLRGTIDEIPDKALPERRTFEQAPNPNLTGSERAYRPSGSMLGVGQRAVATGDYVPWTPDQA